MSAAPMDPLVPTVAPLDDDTLVARLADMGFSETRAREALAVCAGDVSAAASFLISSAVAVAPFAAASSTRAGALAGSSVKTPPVSPDEADDDDELPEPVLVQGPISQYSIEQGRSACTCIALTAAATFLENPNPAILTPQFLQDAVLGGVSNYCLLILACMIPGLDGAPATEAEGTDAPEHFSAEKVMLTNTGTLADPTRLFTCLRQIGVVRQGVLNKDVLHPLGLPSMIHDCWTDGQCDEDLWTAVICTKTPETVLLLLPPLSWPDEKQRFILIDSHPRPHFKSFATPPPTQAYARIHGSLEDLALALNQILPVTVMEDDMINLLYNSFDLYVIQHDAS